MKPVTFLILVLNNCKNEDFVPFLTHVSSPQNLVFSKTSLRLSTNELLVVFSHLKEPIKIEVLEMNIWLFKERSCFSFTTYRDPWRQTCLEIDADCWMLCFGTCFLTYITNDVLYFCQTKTQNKCKNLFEQSHMLPHLRNERSHTTNILKLHLAKCHRFPHLTYKPIVYD